VPKDPGGPERRKLTIHWLCVEVKSAILFWTAILTHYQYRLKQISSQCVLFVFIFPFVTHPLDGSFGELALLFPNTDIDIIAFGQYPYDRAREAKPGTLAAREYAYEYRAPERCGSGSIRIQLYKTSPLWDPLDIVSRNMIPDVLIGLNAGMSTYETWQLDFLTSRARSIPFAVTEFSRVSWEKMNTPTHPG
jgi:hypothetical protein